MGVVAIIILIIAFIYFSRRLERLEEKLDQRADAQPPTAPAAPTSIPQPPADPASQASDPSASGLTPMPAPIPRVVTEAESSTTTSHHGSSSHNAPNWERATDEPDWMEQFGHWISQDFLVKLGALFLLIALGWFVSYAIANDWIGPQGRIALGMLASVAFMLLGVWRMRYFAQQGAIFLVLGAVGVLLTLFAARSLFDLFTPASALFVALLTMTLVGFVAVQYRRGSLAYAALIVGSVAPLLVNSPDPDPVLFFAYLLTVAAGALWVVWHTGWTGLILTSLIITFSYSLLWLLEAADEWELVAMFSFIFVALYYVTNIVSLVRRRAEGDRHLTVHTLTALGTAIFLFVWVQTAVAEEMQSFHYVLWSLVFAVGTYIVYRQTANRPAFYLYASTSAALLAFATAAELDGANLVIAFWFEVAALVIALAWLTRQLVLSAALSWLFVVPMVLSLPYLAYQEWSEPFGSEFAALTFGALLLITCERVFQLFRTPSDDRTPNIRFVLDALPVIAGLYLMHLIWAITHLTLVDGVATTISLVVYTIAGLVLLAHGKASHRELTRYAGYGLIGFVVFRLLLVDVWALSIEGRIITFVLVGCLLLSTAFWLHRAGDGGTSDASSES